MDVLDEVLDASPDAVIVVDDEGVVRRANRNVRTVLGYAPDELDGMAVEDLIPEKSRENHVEHRQEYMQSPEPRPMGRELDLYARHKDGTTIPVEISLGPVEQDSERYVVATVTDVTGRKQREQELQRQNERLEEFVSIVSHDLRNPLNVLFNALELAEETGERQYFDRCWEAVERMDQLIDQLLTLARQGQPVTEKSPVNLARVVDECWRTVETTDATLRVDADCVVEADEGRLKQLLENLFRNAIQHGDPDATVTVGALDGGFYVEDDGPGIPDAERATVFERGHSTVEEGTGFGLAIVEQIASAHGWRVEVVDGEGGGARFEFTGVDAGR